MLEWRNAAVQRAKSIVWRLDGNARALGSALSWRTARWASIGLALLRRHRLNGVTFVGITGSAGKTATKDLAAVILETLGPCARNTVTSNEHIGVAKTLLRTTRAHRHSVVELSATMPGFLDLSLRMVKPHIGVLTLIARDHISSFKSVEAIAAEKAKVIAALPPDGIAVLNRDDPLVRDIGERCGRRVIWIGEGEGATLRLLETESRYPRPLTLKVEHEGVVHEVVTALHGRHLAFPVLAALGIGLAAGVPLPRAIAALRTVPVSPARMQIMPVADGIVFVRDDWKAPLWSFGAPLEFMREAEASRKVLVIGTLSDYSLSASKLYPKVARQALESGDLVVFVGPHAMRALKARRGPDDEALQAFPEIRDAAAFLRRELRAGDLVLVKGSHKADHLTRLILDRMRPVACWTDRCKRGEFCEDCPDLTAAPASEHTVAVVHRLPPREVRVAAAAVPVVVGLGNPRDAAHRTPHNVGQRVLERIVASTGATWTEHAEGFVAEVRLAGRAVQLLRPAANVNNSGPPVREFLDRIGGHPGHCVLIHDDMDLALGDVRVKRGGGDAGHKGVRSIIASFGTGEVARVRVGVRRPGDERKARDLVLQPFAPEEDVALEPAVARAVELVHASVEALSPVAHDDYQVAGIGERPAASS